MDIETDMSSKLTLPDARWFSDKRPLCIVENEMKKRLQALNDFEYSARLQKQGEQIFSQTVRKVPKINVKIDGI